MENTLHGLVQNLQKQTFIWFAWHFPQAWPGPVTMGTCLTLGANFLTKHIIMDSCGQLSSALVRNFLNQYNGAGLLNNFLWWMKSEENGRLLETPSDNVWGLEIISADVDNEGRHDIWHYQDPYDFQLPKSEESDRKYSCREVFYLRGILTLWSL